jgi:hypothetical protein
MVQLLVKESKDWIAIASSVFQELSQTGQNYKLLYC